MAQSDRGGELQVASRCWDVALTGNRVSRGGRSKFDSVHFFFSLLVWCLTQPEDRPHCLFRGLTDLTADFEPLFAGVARVPAGSPCPTCSRSPDSFMLLACYAPLPPFGHGPNRGGALSDFWTPQ